MATSTAVIVQESVKEIKKLELAEIAKEICNSSFQFMIADEDKARRNLRDQALKLLKSLETPTETILRMIYQPHQNAVLKTCVDLGVFKLLEESARTGKPVKATEIETETGADIALIVRLMRVVVASGLCNQLDEEVYMANELTAAVAGPTGDFGIRCLFDLAGPTSIKLPEVLKNTQYRNPELYDRSPMKQAVGLSQFEWLDENPERRTLFNNYMRSRRAGMPAWFEKFPVAKEIASINRKENPKFLVDVGGNKGHDMVAFLKAFPNTEGTLVLEDLPSTLPDQIPGIAIQPYDFFTPQPVEGARLYMFRSIFHDWSDTESRKILANTASAMTPGYSKIIICDFVVPDKNASLFVSLLDIQMMSLGAGRERSEKQWKALLSSAGLEITSIWHGAADSESIIEAMLASQAEPVLVS